MHDSIDRTVAPGPVPQAHSFDPDTATVDGFPLWLADYKHTRAMLASALYVLRSPQHWLAQVIREVTDHPSITPTGLRLFIAALGLEDNALKSAGLQAPVTQSERLILQSLHELAVKGHWLQRSHSILLACGYAIEGKHGFDSRPQVDWIDVDAAISFDLQLDGTVAALRNYEPQILLSALGSEASDAEALREVERGARALADASKARISELQPTEAGDQVTTAKPTEEEIRDYAAYLRGDRVGYFAERLSEARAIYRRCPALVTMERMPAVLCRLHTALQAITGNPDLDESRVPYDPFVSRHQEAKWRKEAIAELKNGTTLPSALPDVRLTAKGLRELRALAFPSNRARKPKRRFGR
jgi:hypothetical protein